MTTFEHGGDIEKFAQEIGCDIDEAIDLSSNINFVKPKIGIDFTNLEISSYPNYDKLFKNIADVYGVDTDEIEIFNGGSSAIFTLFRELDLSHCAIYCPAYLEYKKAAKIFQYKYELINRFTNINQSIKDNSLIVFVNPSTPEGTLYNLENLMTYWISKNAVILIDESFLEFTGGISATRYLNKYERLYILKSMTKFYGSAGIRIGTLISNQKNLKIIKAKEPRWKISQFDSHYIQSALADKTFNRKSSNLNNEAKYYLENILKNSRLIEKIFPSSANFILVKLKNITAPEFQEHLKPYKIMLRDCSNFDFLDDNFVRIAVKNKKLLEKLEEAICI